MTSTPLRIVIADAIFREGLKALLRARNDMNVAVSMNNSRFSPVV